MGPKLLRYTDRPKEEVLGAVQLAAGTVGNMLRPTLVVYVLHRIGKSSSERDYRISCRLERDFVV